MFISNNIAIIIKNKCSIKTVLIGNNNNNTNQEKENISIKMKVNEDV